MKSSLFRCCAAFMAAWVLFAVVDFKSGKDTLRVYQIKEVLDRRPEWSEHQLPKYSAEAVHEYKVSSGKVIGKIGSFVNEYERCKVFDVKNWSCTFSDESATFGSVDGVYFSMSNTSKYPHLLDPLYRDGITVSRLRVVLNKCEWHLLGGVIVGAFECAFVPFITE